MRSKWKSMYHHLSHYHGHRHFWMFGLNNEELEHTHLVCYPWCFKPERDRKVEILIIDHKNNLFVPGTIRYIEERDRNQ